MKATTGTSTRNHVSQLTREKIERWLHKKMASTAERFVLVTNRLRDDTDSATSKPDPNKSNATARLGQTAIMLAAAREALLLGRRAMRDAYLNGDTVGMEMVRERLVDAQRFLRRAFPHSGAAARLYRDVETFLRENPSPTQPHQHEIGMGARA